MRTPRAGTLQLLLFLGISLPMIACISTPSNPNESAAMHTSDASPTPLAPQADSLETATLGNGCFWCTEAIFQRLKGVISVQSGYSGGQVPNPTYKAVCGGKTGHAECLKITFDPTVISYTDLLQVFFKTHDPTTLNRQGNDVGTQYRSVIFYHSEAQAQTARDIIAQLDEAAIWPSPIVTEVSPATTFYAAEDYHQNYYNQNTSQPYCAYTITPKVEKLERLFENLLR